MTNKESQTVEYKANSR